MAANEERFTLQYLERRVVHPMCIWKDRYLCAVVAGKGPGVSKIGIFDWDASKIGVEDQDKAGPLVHVGSIEHHYSGVHSIQDWDGMLLVAGLDKTCSAWEDRNESQGGRGIGEPLHLQLRFGM